MSAGAGTGRGATAIKREAAVWIARLHSPDRDAAVEAGLRQWLAESAEHREVFERANELWESAARVPDEAFPRVMRWQRVRAFTRAVQVASAVGVALVVTLLVFVVHPFHSDMLSTSVGEQRMVTLEDGSRVTLNTATRLRVHYDRKVRGLTLQSGEALFEVARQPGRPFVVTSGEQRVTALGTSFVVLRDHDRTAVTLVEGRVSVAPTIADAGAGAVQRTQDVQRPSAGTLLVAGERLTFAPARAPVLDRPEIGRLTAWERGLVSLDHTRLVDAVAEMNRYSSLKLSVQDADAGEALVSGVFRAGDSLEFAQAISSTYGLAYSQQADRIVISGHPQR